MIANNIFSDPNYLLQLDKDKKEAVKGFLSLTALEKVYDIPTKCIPFRNYSKSLFNQIQPLPLPQVNKKANSSEEIVKKKEKTIPNNIESSSIKKKAGRRCSKKQDSNLNEIKENNINVHSKRTKDNVRRKVKVKFTHFVINFLNQYIKVNWKGFQKYKFRTIDNKITKDISIKTNKKLFDTTVGEYLSHPVSSKFKCNQDQNKKIAAKIEREKPEIFKDILNMKMVDFYNKIYRGDPKIIREERGLNIEIGDKRKNKLLFFDEYLTTLANDLNYLMIYHFVGSQFFNFYYEQRGRKSRANKKEEYNEEDENENTVEKSNDFR